MHAIAMAAKVRSSRDQIEQVRCLQAEIIKAMEEAGVFGMAMPLTWGGPELDPLTQFNLGSLRRWQWLTEPSAGLP